MSAYDDEDLVDDDLVDDEDDPFLTDGEEDDAEPADEAAAQPASRQASAGGGVQEPPQTLFPNADAWLRGWLLVTWQPPIMPAAKPALADIDRDIDSSGVYWCQRWWLHPEAKARIEVLWRSWEKLREDPWMGLATWFRDHFDHHWPRVTGPHGPLSRCTPTVHRDITHLSAIPVGVHLANGANSGRWYTDDEQN